MNTKLRNALAYPLGVAIGLGICALHKYTNENPHQEITPLCWADLNRDGKQDAIVSTGETLSNISNSNRRGIGVVYGNQITEMSGTYWTRTKPETRFEINLPQNIYDSNGNIRYEEGKLEFEVGNFDTLKGLDLKVTDLTNKTAQIYSGAFGK
jgi:hypothetical protein